MESLSRQPVEKHS